MSVLDEIVIRKKEEVAAQKARMPIQQLASEGPFYEEQRRSLVSSLQDTEKTGIIAEFKRRSPSKGLINGDVNVREVTQAYAAAGASGLSVLTDEAGFGGSPEDLHTARRENPLPVLRKDFIIDPYQIPESRAMGADVILLIAACLEPARLQELAAEAHTHGMEVLLEVHNAEELEANLFEEIDIVGVNNRNLKDFTVNTQTSVELSPLIPADKIKISESGLYNAETVLKLKEAGYRGFLIGESFMKEKDPGEAMRRLVEAVNQQKVQ